MAPFEPGDDKRLVKYDGSVFFFFTMFYTLVISFRSFELGAVESFRGMYISSYVKMLRVKLVISLSELTCCFTRSV